MDSVWCCFQVSLRFATPQAMAGVPKFPFPFFGGFPFPTMPPMGFPAIPSVQDIAGSIPAGGTYNGVMVSTQSESKRNEDGTVVKSGGSTVMINDNGKVTVEKSMYYSFPNSTPHSSLL